MPATTDSKLKKTAYAFIAENRTASLATVDDKSRPHLSIVYCIAESDLSIYFTTRAEGRKFYNLVQNPHVSMIFSAHDTVRQLQLSGVAKRLRNHDRELDILHYLWKLRYNRPDLIRPPKRLIEPGARKEFAIFKVTPTEMTYTNFETDQVGRYQPKYQQVI